jgi:Spy/CpxP family protein refolding chaperone
MKSIRKLLWTSLLSAAAVVGAAGASVAGAADDAMSTAPPGAHAGHHHGGPWHLLGKLDLSAAQKQQIKEILAAAHPQMLSLHEQMRANSLKLRQTPPTDPNYTSITSQVSQTHGSLVAQMMSQHADVRAQVYKVLTPAQQTQLTALEAQMPTHEHGAWGGPHGPNLGAAPPTQ